MPEPGATPAGRYGLGRNSFGCFLFRFVPLFEVVRRVRENKPRIRPSTTRLAHEFRRGVFQAMVELGTEGFRGVPEL